MSTKLDLDPTPMHPLKLLQINKLYFPVTGGIEKVVQQIAEGLADRTDMKVLVCQAKGKGAVEEIHQVEVHRAASWGTYFSMPLSLSFPFQLLRLSRDRDVLLFHEPFPLADAAFWLFRMKRFPGKVVLWWHSDIVKQKRLKALFRPAMHYLLERADAIIVATEGHIKGSEDLAPYKEKCVIIPFGLDPVHEPALEVSPQKKEKESQQLSSAAVPVTFLFVGRLVYYKGCHVLLDAFSRIKGPAELILAGDGPLKAQLEHQARQLGLEKQVHFCGAVDDEKLIRLYRQCDVFVLPSIAKSEAFGLVQVEAMAYGKPVINTDLPSGVPYVSLHGQTGLTVPPEKPEALAQAMQLLLDRPDLRRQYGCNARERVRQFYSMDAMLEKVFRLCSWEPETPPGS